MSAFDLGCVKTQKFEKRRELFFSDQAKANTLKNSRHYNCDSEKRSFYRRRAPFCGARAAASDASGRVMTFNPAVVAKNLSSADAFFAAVP